MKSLLGTSVAANKMLFRKHLHEGVASKMNMQIAIFSTAPDSFAKKARS